MVCCFALDAIFGGVVVLVLATCLWRSLVSVNFPYEDRKRNVSKQFSFSLRLRSSFLGQVCNWMDGWIK